MRCATLLMAVAAAASLATVHGAPYASDFEALSASAAGTVLTGQDGYYIPPATTSVDFLAYTYAGNALGLPANPGGGRQFIAGEGPGAGTYARAQRDITYGSGAWEMSFDVAATFVGQLPTGQNLGSVSQQPSGGSASGFPLARWADTATARNWNADYVYYNAAGGQITDQVPDTNFQNLLTDHWYHWSTVFDFDTNRILQLSLTDLVSGTTWTHAPTDWYLQGGAAGGLPTPTAFRFFAGGGAADAEGNVLAFDNISIEPADIIPEPATLSLLALGGLALLRRRKR